MEIRQEFAIDAPADSVWAALEDLALVASCLPGAEVLEVDPAGTRARGRMTMRLGPIAAGFEGEATVDRDDERREARLDGKGADRKSSSRAQMKMVYRVVPEDKGARVEMSANIALSGILAQFSKGPIVNEVAAQLTREFAANLQARLAASTTSGELSTESSLAPAVASRPAMNPLALLWRVALRQMRTSGGDLFSHVVLPLLFAVGVLGVWEATTRIFEIKEVLLPAPSAIWQRLNETFPLLVHHAWPTIWESVAGFIIASVLGITLAALLSASTLMRRMLYPNVVFFQLIPKIALAPLFIVWLGIGFESRLAFSVFISFFPVVVATLAGLDNVDKSLLRLCRALTASNWQVFASVRFPHALPYVFSGMKIATTFAIIGVIVGEFITSQQGLGYLILFASAQADTALILAAITVLCAFGLVFYGLVALLEKFVTTRLGG